MNPLRDRYVVERPTEEDQWSIALAWAVSDDLSDDDLRQFRDDLWAVLSAAPAEARAVLGALHAGTVDGSNYTGDCACLIGTISKTRGCDIEHLGALKPDSSRLAETWFMQIVPGNTPENHGPTKLAAEWIAQWIGAMEAAFGASAKTESAV